MIYPERTYIRFLHRKNEDDVISLLLDETYQHEDLMRIPLYDFNQIKEKALALVREARTASKPSIDIAEFLKEYSLNSSEGVALLSIAEALLRIPDAKTANAFIKDKILLGKWDTSSNNFFVKLSAKAFKFTSGIMTTKLSCFGEPFIRTTLKAGIKFLAKQFIVGENIRSAIKNTNVPHSFDMLGESAKTMADANKYLKAYKDAIKALNKTKDANISIKLSALYPRYEPLQPCVPILANILLNICILAKENNVSITIDAEESERLEISLDIFEIVISDPALDGWDGLGLAVQAYQKRATAVIDWIVELAKLTNHRVPVRLVKGAYWDTEIKNAQMLGLDYPVFTIKSATDVSWIVCAKKMIEHNAHIKSAFATHNAHSLAYIMATAFHTDFEMQRLHGMGEALYRNINCPVRVYGPVGSYEDLLAYLVRRMLENGANNSFVHNLVDPLISENDIVSDPIKILENKRQSNVISSSKIYSDRKNSIGIDFSDKKIIELLNIQAIPIVKHHTNYETQMNNLVLSFSEWNRTSIDIRTKILEKTAQLIENNTSQLLYLLAIEAGKTLVDGAAEIREAIDYCRYYANLARQHFGEKTLEGPTGERNIWSLSGKGVFACISPWNFPLAIFVGQISAALVSGNTVAAKAAKQAPLIATKMVEILYEAGIPNNVLSLFLEDDIDGIIGAKLVKDHRISGVSFTGGTETAKHIARSLSDRNGPIIPFIAETGGINAMIADTTALPEQLVSDIIVSAFGSAGQRCSSLRLLCLPKEISNKIITMLKGAVELLKVGNPLELSSDIGPIIDSEAKAALVDYCNNMGEPLFKGADNDNFFFPRAYLLDDVSNLKEIFGPILHIVVYDNLDDILKQINQIGFGLTLGIHSRNETTQNYIIDHVRVGNIYVNRNQIGAVVGAQPFGGMGMSGTGPKAGGPLSLFRYVDECVVSVNTSIIGNIELLKN
jgi:RHH-type transcriptional regulator, proline utilization regulon repressor / proline dehydrogenase / delta 1-pyrroline-5-carboxylate dehydrogenase